MALIKCTNCGHPISDKAKKCPKCGVPMQKKEEAVVPPIQEVQQAKDMKRAIQAPLKLQEIQAKQPKTVEEPKNEENVFVSASGKVYRMDGAQQKKKSNVWIVVVCAVLLFVLVGTIAVTVATSEDKAIVVDDTPIVLRQTEEEFDVKRFIMGYYDAVVNGGYASYFEDYDITFFNLEHVSKSEVVKAIGSAPKRNTSREYDWATLRTTALSMGTIKAVFASDYYIHYESRTDKYRITTEMIISPNRKIQSLKDIETVKMGLPLSTFVEKTTEGNDVSHCRLQNKEIAKNLKKLGFELIDSRTEQRLDYTGTEYFDFTIETYSKTVDGRTTTVKLEEDETEIHFPNLDEVREFSESVRESGMRETADGFEDPEEIDWVGTIVSIKGTIVVLTYKWEP